MHAAVDQLKASRCHVWSSSLCGLPTDDKGSLFDLNYAWSHMVVFYRMHLHQLLLYIGMYIKVDHIQLFLNCRPSSIIVYDA